MVDRYLSLCLVGAVLSIRALNALPTTMGPPDIQCRGHGRKYKSVDSDGTVVCKTCAKCPPGQGVSIECTEYEDTVCEPCITGETFSGTESSWRQCEGCSVCDSHELMKRECTPTRNSRCGSCIKGYFLNDITGDCDRCSWCYPEYPAIADHFDECDVTGVKPGFQCGPILDPPYPPPLDNMEQVTLAGAKDNRATTFVLPHPGQSDDMSSEDREKRTSEVYQTSPDFRFISSRTTPTKSSLPKDARTTISAYARTVLTVQQPIFSNASDNTRVVFSTEQRLTQSAVPPTALGVVLGVLVVTVLGTFLFHRKIDRKKYERERVRLQDQPLVVQETSGEEGDDEILQYSETDNLSSGEAVVVV